MKVNVVDDRSNGISVWAFAEVDLPIHHLFTCSPAAHLLESKVVPQAKKPRVCTLSNCFLLNVFKLKLYQLP